MEEIGRIVYIDSIGKHGVITGTIDPNKYYILLGDGSTLVMEKARLIYVDLEACRSMSDILDCLMVLDKTKHVKEVFDNGKL